MFDFLKTLTKSEEEKQQETFSAYLDNTLSANQRQKFEVLLTQDADLRAELEMAQSIRQQMQEMPRRSVPRSFTLDASVYGVPKREPLVQAYPFLRVATVMTAFFFVLALGLNVFSSQGGNSVASMAQSPLEAAPAMVAPLPEAEIAMEAAVEEPTAAKAAEAFAVAEEEVEEEAAGAMLAEATALATAAVSETELMVEAPTAEALAYAAAEAAESLPAASAPAGGAADETALLVPEATATVSSLPRPDVTEEAVSRLAEPTLSAQDELANAGEMETAVSEEAPSQNLQDTRPSLTNSQWLLIGLGLLLLILMVVTLLARRKM